MDELTRKRHSSTERGRVAIVAGLVVGCFLTWNISNVGAVADPLAEAYGVSLAVIGLLTTALFVTHLAAQLPAYAVPVFLRRVGEIETTATFKTRKHTLREEGVDPARVADPLLVLLDRARGYEPLTPELWRQLVAGTLRL